MNKKTSFFIIIPLFLGIISPVFVKADGGMFVDPKIKVYESDQNAIVAWNGSEEMFFLSTSLMADQDNVSAIQIVALPQNPLKVEEGDYKSFENLVQIMNSKIPVPKANELGKATGVGDRGGEPAVVLTFHDKVGAHDINVIKINDLQGLRDWEYLKTMNIDSSKIDSNFLNALNNYMLRGINYFAFDRVDIGSQEKTINPIIYHFNTNYLYYPIKITAFSPTAVNGKNTDNIHLFLITKNQLNDPLNIFNSRYVNWRHHDNIKLSFDELKNVSDKISALFTSDVYATEFTYNGALADTKDDIIIYSPGLWQNNMRIGTKAEDVLALQNILINEGFWNNQTSATGYFGPLTKANVIKFQEKYAQYILKPLGLKNGTGFVGPYTRNFMKQFQMQ
jgi:hypothetical protein